MSETKIYEKADEVERGVIGAAIDILAADIRPSDTASAFVITMTIEVAASGLNMIVDHDTVGVADYTVPLFGGVAFMGQDTYTIPVRSNRTYNFQLTGALADLKELLVHEVGGGAL